MLGARSPRPSSLHAGLQGPARTCRVTHLTSIRTQRQARGWGTRRPAGSHPAPEPPLGPPVPMPLVSLPESPSPPSAPDQGQGCGERGHCPETAQGPRLGARTAVPPPGPAPSRPGSVAGGQLASYAASNAAPDDALAPVEPRRLLHKSRPLDAVSLYRKVLQTHRHEIRQLQPHRQPPDWLPRETNRCTLSPSSQPHPAALPNPNHRWLRPVKGTSVQRRSRGTCCPPSRVPTALEVGRGAPFTPPSIMLDTPVPRKPGS